MSYRISPMAVVAAALISLAGCHDSPPPQETPPLSPSGVNATPGNAQNSISWNTVSGATSYNLYWQNTSGVTKTSGTRIAGVTAPYIHSGLTNGTAYYYVVTAQNSAGESAVSAEVSATPAPQPPPAPDGVSAAPGDSQNTVSWNTVSGATSYNIYWQSTSGVTKASGTKIADVTTPYAHIGLTNGTTYYYIVTAANGNGESVASLEASATPVPPAPGTPAGVSAAPGNTQAILSWTAVAGATSYNVYTSTTSPVTTAGTKTSVASAGTTLSALTNGTPVYAAVTAVNAGGESAVSSEVCVVPTAASTDGLTLYDALCEKELDGQKWRSPLYSRRVTNGALELRTQVANTESLSIRGLRYQTSTNVNAGGQRVTTLKADISVPAATASRTGNADIRAVIRLVYQPPATRLIAPANNLDLIVAQLGLIDNGNGLRAMRQVVHCDNIYCSSAAPTGIAFVDPPGFEPRGNQMEAPASYDTVYTVTMSLNETTGAFTWLIAGGEFGAGVSGTADPGDYVTTNANWAALGPNPLAGPAFVAGSLVSRVHDQSVAAGSAGSVTGRFDNVYVGLNNGAPVLWDDFSGSGGNSGPVELSATKWGTPGMNSMNLADGSLAFHSQIISPSASSIGNFQAIVFNHPETINTLQADVKVTACGSSVSSYSQVSLEGNLYNDGTAGTTSPNDNEPNSLVGDVRALLILDCNANAARFVINRYDSTSPQLITGLTNFANNAIPTSGSPVVGNTHTLRLSWDPVAHLITFQVDGAAPVVVDPTTVNVHMSIAAPYVKPANSPLKQLATYISASAGGATAHVDFKVNNVFTAP